MTTNGKRRARRPAIELIAPSANPEQAAAIAAALEQFLQDTTPVLSDAPTRTNPPWGRAALAEGVGLEPPTPWGDPEPWG